jgi:hypothetical protein
MKSCPKCNRTYFDETFAFCLADGTLLTAPFDPEATQVLPTAIDPPARVAGTNRRVAHDEFNRSKEGLGQEREQEAHHSPSELKRLFKQFLSHYDLDGQNEIWKRQSQIFKHFWKEKILNTTYQLLIPGDTDLIIRMLDTGARRHEEVAESVALTNLRQPMWERLFNDLKEKKNIQGTTDQIFNETEESGLISLIDCLERENKGNGNSLTGKNAVAINALLCINNPEKFLKSVSLAHRFQIMRAFYLGNPDEFKTYGQEVVLSNRRIIDSFKERYGINAEPLALTEFLYSRGARRNWGRTNPTNIRPMWWDTHSSSKSKNS